MTTLASDPLGGPRVCEACGMALRGKRPKRYCDAKCRAVAHRTRQAVKAQSILRALKTIETDIEDLFGSE